MPVYFPYMHTSHIKMYIIEKRRHLFNIMYLYLLLNRETWAEYTVFCYAYVMLSLPPLNYLPCWLQITSWKDGYFTWCQEKNIAIGQNRLYDHELIYERVIELLASKQFIVFNNDIAYGIATYPPSMFDKDGQMKTGKS